MSTITHNIERLEQLIESEIQKANFYPGVEANEIAKFEKENEIIFPKEYALFLKHFNGGFITEYNWTFYTDMTPDEPDGPQYSSFNFFSLEELSYSYIQLMLENKWLFEEFGDDFVFPVIPIAQTPDQEILFLLSEEDNINESALFLADTFDLSEDVYKVSDDFNSFLGFYVQSNGFPKLKQNAITCKLRDQIG